MKNSTIYLFTFLALVTGCATEPYPAVAFDAQTASVSEISIIRDTFPDDASVSKFATNGANVGAAAAGAHPIGLLIAVAAGATEASIATNQKKRLNQVLGSAGFDGEAHFNAALRDALSGNGFEIAFSDQERKSNARLIELQAISSAERGQAVLDIAGVGYGYQIAGTGTTWRPFVLAEVRLSRAADPEDVLFQDRIAFNPVGMQHEVVTVFDSNEFSFESINAIESDPERAAAGLSAALTETALTIAKLLQ